MKQPKQVQKKKMSDPRLGFNLVKTNEEIQRINFEGFEEEKQFPRDQERLYSQFVSGSNALQGGGGPNMMIGIGGLSGTGSVTSSY